MSFNVLVGKVRRRIIRLRLKPIRVFCLHQVSPERDPIRCFESDWIQTDLFKRRVMEMKKEYTFIPLMEAYNKLRTSFLRCKKYAVLTFDDGYLSSYPALKWLEDKRIPFTLFLNAKYFDGDSCSWHLLENARSFTPNITERELAEGLYLTKKELALLSSQQVSFASHGFEHCDATSLNSREFLETVQESFSVLEQYSQTIPFHAYTWGKHTEENDAVLRGMGVVPVLMDGEMNYDKCDVIHREVFPMQ